VPGKWNESRYTMEKGLRREHPHTKSRVLLFESDREAATSIVDVLKQSCSIELVHDVKTALLLLRQDTFDACICQATPRAVSEDEVLREILSVERFRKLPFIKLVDREGREGWDDWLEVGVDDLWPVARLSSDCVWYLELVLQRYQSAPALQGKLRHLSVPDLLQILTHNRRTGRLEIVNKEDSFFFLFCDGQLMRATAIRSGVRGENAVYRALQQEEGDGEFRFHLFDERKELLCGTQRNVGNVDFLSMEGLRQRDEIQLFFQSVKCKRPMLRVDATKTPVPSVPQEARDVYQWLLTQNRFVDFWDICTAFRNRMASQVSGSLTHLHRAKCLLAKESNRRPSQPTLPDDIGKQATHRYTGSQLYKIPSYHALVSGILKGETLWALSSVIRVVSEGMPPSFVYHKMLGNAFKELLQAEQEGKLDEPLSLPLVQDVFERILGVLMPLFSEAPPLHNTIIVGRPVGEFGTQQMITTLLRAAGFGVVDLGSRITPSRFVEVAISSGASSLCIPVRTEGGAKLIHYVRQLLDQQRLQRIVILAAGSYFKNVEEAKQFGAASLAFDALDVVRQSYLLSGISIKPPQA